MVMEADDSAINVPAVAAARVIKRYIAQAPDEVSLEVETIFFLYISDIFFGCSFHYWYTMCKPGFGTTAF